MEFVLSVAICIILEACLVAGIFKELAEVSPARFGEFKGLFKF